MNADKKLYKLVSSTKKGKIYIMDVNSEEVWELFTFSGQGSVNTHVATNAKHLLHIGISEEVARDLIDSAVKNAPPSVNLSPGFTSKPRICPGMGIPNSVSGSKSRTSAGPPDPFACGEP